MLHFLKTQCVLVKSHCETSKPWYSWACKKIKNIKKSKYRCYEEKNGISDIWHAKRFWGICVRENDTFSQEKWQDHEKQSIQTKTQAKQQRISVFHTCSTGGRSLTGNFPTTQNDGNPGSHPGAGVGTSRHHIIRIGYRASLSKAREKKYSTVNGHWVNNHTSPPLIRMSQTDITNWRQ